MGFLRRLRSGVGARVGATFDPFRGDVPIGQFVEELCAGEWEHADAFLAGRDDAWLVSEIIVSDTSEVPTSVIEEWAMALPSARSWTLLGRAQTRDAWAIRGRAFAADVDPSAWSGFFSGLEKAEETLQRAVELGPGSADPWVGLMTTARGLELGREEVTRRFNEAHGRDPFRADACNTMLQGLCHKWGGSHEEMFDFARWVEAEAPADSPARVVLPMAHIERVVSGMSEGLRFVSYSTQPDVAAELTDAAWSYLDAVGSDVEAQHLEPLNAMLLALIAVDRRSAAATHRIIERVAGRATEMPWRYFQGDVGVRYRQVCAERRNDAAPFR